MTFTDHLHRTVRLPALPRRIVSLVPSQTELLFDLGLGERVVGLTKFCVHPLEQCRAKPKVGGTKQVSLEKIAALRPDLIIGNKEENDRAQVEEMARHWPVWMSDITTLEDALNMVRSVGDLTGTTEAASQLASQITAAFLSPNTLHISPITAAYLIWYRPWMAVGSGTFIHSMLEWAGFKNVCEAKTRYPEVTLEELAAAGPQVVMLSSEPYPFRQRHFDEIRQICPQAAVQLVDGELFSWYGSRMLRAAPYLRQLHHELSKTLKTQLS